MKSIRSYIFVITIVMILLLLTACIQIIPPSDDNTSEKPANPIEDDIAVNNETPTQKPVPAKETPDAPQPSVLELFLNEQIMVDLNGDGSMTEIAINDVDGKLVLSSAQGGFDNDILIADIPAGHLTNAYYVKSADGYPFVVVSYDYISDDFETSVFSFKGFEPNRDLTLPLYVTRVDEFGFDAYGYVQAVGTWAASASVYFILDTIEWRGTYILDQDSVTYTQAKTVMNLPVQIWSSGDYVSKVLAPGTVISFVETDGESYISFVLDDGTEGYISFEWNSDWIELIDGIRAYEYFEELPLFG